MIYTVTFNPALDKTVTIDNFKLNEVNRVLSIKKDAGGKGINVSKMLDKLGGKSCAAGFLGLETGKYIEKELTQAGIQTCFVHTHEETRVNLKVVDPLNSTFTDINEPGGIVSQADIKSLKSKLLSMVKSDDIVVFSGKTANGMEDSVVKEWSLQCKHKGAKVFVDAEGKTLKLAVEAQPYMIKPNLEELKSICGKKLDNQEAVILECDKLIKSGISIVALSLGENGALFFYEDDRFYAKALKVEVKSTVGAGDSMMAAFAYGVQHNLGLEEKAKLSMAASAAKVTCEGTEMPDKEQVYRLLDKVCLERIT